MISTLKFLAQMEVNADSAMERIQKTSKAWDYMFSDTIQDLDGMYQGVVQARNAVARNFVMFSLFKGEVNTFPIRTAFSRLVSSVQRSMYMKFADLDTVEEEVQGEMILMRFLSMCGRSNDINFSEMYYTQLSEAFGETIEDFEGAMKSAVQACYNRDTEIFRNIADMTCGFSDVVTEYSNRSIPLVDLSWLLPLFPASKPTIAQDAIETVEFMNNAKHNDMIRTINSLLGA